MYFYRKEDIKKFLVNKQVSIIGDLKQSKIGENVFEVRIKFFNDDNIYNVIIHATDFCFKIYENNKNSVKNIVSDMTFEWIEFLSRNYKKYADSFKKYFEFNIKAIKRSAELEIFSLELQKNIEIMELDQLKDKVLANHDEQFGCDEQGKGK